MKIQWLGHASFLITLRSDEKIITDPFDAKVGYPLPGLHAGIVTVSHQHFDHNAVENVPGRPDIVREEGPHSFGEIKITGIPSFHDTVKGSQRGENIIFIIEADWLKVCHLGDLGHVLDPGQVGQIGDVDVLLIPVGGYFTIDAGKAVNVVEQLKPKIVVPMHYKTSYVDLPISNVDNFLSYYPEHRTERELVVSAEEMPPAMQVVRLELRLGENDEL